MLIDPEFSLDTFKHDPNYLEKEKHCEEFEKTMLDDDEEGSDAYSEVDENELDDDSDEESMQIKDKTETDRVNLRRTNYLTIMSSLGVEEAGHKLVKIHLEPGEEMELCYMLLEFALAPTRELTNRIRLLLRSVSLRTTKCIKKNLRSALWSSTQRFTSLKQITYEMWPCFLLICLAQMLYIGMFYRTFASMKKTQLHHLVYSSRYFSRNCQSILLNQRLSDPTMQKSFESIFPKDNLENTRFCINLFTAIGLGGLTENLREHLKNMQQQKQVSDSESASESDREPPRKQRRK